MTVESNYVVLIGIKGLHCLQPMRSKTQTYHTLCGLFFLGLEEVVDNC